MKKSGIKNPGGNIIAAGITLILVLNLALAAQGSFSINTSLSYNNYNYLFSGSNNFFYLNLGARYNTSNFSLSASIPLVIQNNTDSLSGTNDFFNNDMGTSEHIRPSLGDIYLYGEYHIFRSGDYSTSFSLTGQLKIPTSSTLSSYSSGKYDYGAGIVTRKLLGDYNFFGDLSYLVLGDPFGFIYQDPLIYGIGAGRFFDGGKYSFSLYYRGYTQISEGVEPPKQLSLGFFVWLSRSTSLSAYAVKGFSESSPDLAFTIGFDVGL